MKANDLIKYGLIATLGGIAYTAYAINTDKPNIENGLDVGDILKKGSGAFVARLGLISILIGLASKGVSKNG